jgi:hypothetical protein
MPDGPGHPFNPDRPVVSLWQGLLKPLRVGFPSILSFSLTLSFLTLAHKMKGQCR